MISVEKQNSMSKIERQLQKDINFGGSYEKLKDFKASSISHGGKWIEGRISVEYNLVGPINSLASSTAKQTLS